jgi:pimeloyl-ACP methyl ester carboxylesterase
VPHAVAGHPTSVILNHVRRGSGAPLVLVHGLGGSLRSWDLVVDGLAAHREVVALDLPGFGASPPLPETTVATLADAVALFLSAQGLQRADLVGTSLGGRLVLEMVRRGLGRHVVALDPGGYWNGPERAFAVGSLRASIAAVRRLRRVLPVLAGNPVTRAALLGQFSARPWAVPGDVVLRELRGLADAPAVDPALAALAAEPPQLGAPAGSAPGRLTVGWGRWDRLTLPTQARRALAAFPDATLHRFRHSGHFPMFDSPDETVQMVLEATS